MKSLQIKKITFCIFLFLSGIFGITSYLVQGNDNFFSELCLQLSIITSGMASIVFLFIIIDALILIVENTKPINQVNDWRSKGVYNTDSDFISKQNDNP